MPEADSPAGAYKELGYEKATGKANFGFVSKSIRKKVCNRDCFFIVKSMLTIFSERGEK